jgi:lipopolysaccharide transport system permease protein
VTGASDTGACGPGCIAAARNIVSVAWLLARRDILSDLRSSKLSLLWPLLYPLAYTTLFVLLKPVVQGGLTAFSWTYALHVFIGFSLWQLWFEGLRAQMEAVRSNKSLLSRADLSPSSLFLAGYFVQAIQLLPRLLLGVAGAAVFVGSVSPTDVLLFIVMSLIVILNGCAIGFLLQPFSTLLADVSKVLQSASLALLVSGGVFFVIPTGVDAGIAALLAINPLAPLIEAARAPLLSQPMVFVWAPWIWALLTVVALAIQASVARKVLPVLLERIGA